MRIRWIMKYFCDMFVSEEKNMFICVYSNINFITI